jgi:hypothetical protein
VSFLQNMLKEISPTHFKEKFCHLKKCTYFFNRVEINFIIKLFYILLEVGAMAPTNSPFISWPWLHEHTLDFIRGIFVRFCTKWDNICNLIVGCEDITKIKSLE